LGLVSVTSVFGQPYAAAIRLNSPFKAVVGGPCGTRVRRLSSGRLAADPP
jgi:hypothetical protein